MTVLPLTSAPLPYQTAARNEARPGTAPLAEEIRESQCVSVKITEGPWRILSEAVAVNLAAALSMRASAASRELRVGVHADPQSDVWRFLFWELGPGPIGLLSAPEADPKTGRAPLWDGGEHLAKRLEEDPGHIEEVRARLAALRPHDISPLVVERHGISFIPSPGMYHSSLPRAYHAEIYSTLSNLARAHLQEHCDVLFLAPQARMRAVPEMRFDPGPADTTIAVVENSEGELAAPPLQEDWKIALLTERLDQYYSGEPRPRPLPHLGVVRELGRVPTASASLDLYELSGGRSGRVLMGGRSEDAQRFADLTAELLRDLPGCEFLAEDFSLVDHLQMQRREKRKRWWRS